MKTPTPPSSSALKGGKTKGIGTVSALKPIFTYSGHATEGFAMDWSPVAPLRYARTIFVPSLPLWG